MGPRHDELERHSGRRTADRSRALQLHWTERNVLQPAIRRYGVYNLAGSGDISLLATDLCPRGDSHRAQRLTTVTVLAGARTIGGLQVAVEDDEGARLLFDCGIAFSPSTDPFAHVRHRPGKQLADLLALKLAPYVPGLYGAEHLSGLTQSLQPAIRPSKGPIAVALSHSHLDHTHLAGFVDSSHDVYASPATQRIVQLMGELGVTLAPSPSNMTPVSASAPFTVGSMRVRVLPIDHDVGGASGLLIETPDGVIAYPGDFRYHGRHPELTSAFAAAAREAATKLLILEGTQLWPAPEEEFTEPRVDRDEVRVAPDIALSLDDFPEQPAVVILSPANGERVEEIAFAAAARGRRLVLTAESLAFAISALGRNLTAPYVVRDDDLDNTHAPALQRLGNVVETIPTSAVALDPGAFVIELPFERFADLIDLLAGRPGGVVISSNGSPLGPFDPAWASLERWSKAFDMSPLPIGSSGHARPADLARFSREVGAGVVMAVHSHYPELMPVDSQRLLLPDLGRAYDLSALDC